MRRFTRSQVPLVMLLAIVVGAIPALALAQQATPVGTPAAATPVASPELERKIGQMLLAGVLGTTVIDDARQMIENLHVGNIILMGRNIDSPDQVLALTQELQSLAIEENGIGRLIATDQEGGLVQRLNYVSGFTLMPAESFVGETESPDLIRRYGQMVGEELLAVGVNWNMAPVLDVNTNPDNPVIGSLGRSYGATPELVETAGVAFIEGLHDAGVAATGKHFPGHGSTTEDSHHSLPYVTEDRATLEAIDLVPFQAAIDHGVDAIMPAHVVYDALDPSGLPATVSEPIQTGLLRGELGFDGVIVTDDLGMAGITELFDPGEAAVRAVLAGADMLTCVRMPDFPGSCSPEMIETIRDGLIEAVNSGRISEERIDESVERITALKERYQVGPATGDGLNQIQSPEHLRVVGDLFYAVADRREGGPAVPEATPES
jgi:beta-N-acetylhexosaminidase